MRVRGQCECTDFETTEICLFRLRLRLRFRLGNTSIRSIPKPQLILRPANSAK